VQQQPISRKQAKAYQHLREALAIHGAGRPGEAVPVYERAIAASPDLAPAHAGRGVALSQLGRHEEGLKSLNRAAGLDRANPNILINRGTVLNELARPVEALEDFERAIALGGETAAAHYGAGNALTKLRRPAEALARFDCALELQPRFALALTGRAQALAALDRPEEALQSYDAALRLDPSSGKSWYNRGACLMGLRRFRDALSDFQRSLERDPNNAKAYAGSALALAEMGHAERALPLFDRALGLDLNEADARAGRAIALFALQRFEESLTDFDKAVEQQPDNAALFCFREMALRSIHQWREPRIDDAQLRELIETASKVPSPFLLSTLSGDAALQKSVAVRYARPLEAAAAPPPPLASGHERIRIGYFSADFHDHATMHLLAEMLERHDRERFEVTAFSYGPGREDEWRKRARNAVEHFVDVAEKTDAEIAAIGRAMELDIAVDLKGFTQLARPFIFAARPAPVQVSYLGYPGTTGCSFIDYIIADRVLIPPDHRKFYSEKIVCLPGSYQPNCRDRRVERGSVTRFHVGLPEDAMVYCSFNQGYKVTPATFDVWMDILREVEGSVLWIWVPDEPARERLRLEANRRGADPSRLVFADSLPVPEHLGRIHLADLFLDTLPCNAHTTASDALGRGVPVLTCPGEAFASRVAASLLNAIGLPEMIAPSLQDYARLAIELGKDRKRRERIKLKLASQLPTSPLFDSARYTRDIEAAYAAIYSRLTDDLPPDHIDIAPLA
jgi:protein O-GlcNAc transferase